ncbi:MAG: zinc ribbon domain-containing protein [Candidatus Obscuribacterales bacterium]|nr:zinc ribbon domain-containing protein [Candidatus Obscuribacterales bacterium]
MPSYDYKCTSCNGAVTLDRSMSDSSTPVCTHCGSDQMNRVWSVFIVSGGSTPDVGQSAKSSGASKKSGCGSCSSHSCGTC